MRPYPSAANGPFDFDLYTSQVLVSYSMDVWGLNRRTVEAQQALADEQRFTVEAAYLTLTSNVVVAAIQEASLRGQIDATIKIIALNKKALDILRQQFNAGYASRIDLAAQEAILAQEEATLPPLQKQLAITRDLLTALLGRYPSEEPFQTFNLESLQLPQDLPVSLPSRLIEQRPDVRLAEEQMHSASALVGVATANMLPNFTINANGGYTALTLAGLLHPFNAFWLLSGNVTQTVFDAGNLLHLRRQAEANYDQTGWTYRSVLIGALQNVADSLHALQYDAAALKAAREIRARRQDQPRPLAPAAGDRPGQCPLPAAGAADLSDRRRSASCRRGPTACPTRRRCSSRWAAAGGTGSSRRTRRSWTSARTRRSRSSIRMC